MRTRFSKAAMRLGVSAEGGAGAVLGASDGVAGTFAASRLASRSSCSTTSLRNSPSAVKGRRSITRNASSGLWSDKVLSPAISLACSLSRVASRSRCGALRFRFFRCLSKLLTPGQWFEKLGAVQARLRAPNGCPWDREQTHRSLRTYLIEEAYEVLEALESGNDAKFAEEMGDLLLQIVFHSQIAREEGR